MNPKDELNEQLAHAKRVSVMASACALLVDLTLEWDSSFTWDIRLWIVRYLTRNLDTNNKEHMEAYELARRILGDDE